MKYLPLLIFLLCCLAGSMKSEDTVKCVAQFFFGFQFETTNYYKSMTSQAANGCVIPCQTDDECVAFDVIDGFCRFYKLNAGETLKIKQSPSFCNQKNVQLYVKLYIPPSENCFPERLIEFWYRNTTMKFNNGLNYKFQEDGDSGYKLMQV